MNPIIGRWYFSLLVVVLCHGQLPVFAQGEFNNWFFGNKAGISFATVTPSNLVGSQMTTVTSTVSISDSNGVLQFYSNGWHVYDRNHGIMANGTLIWGMNYNQPVFAVPKIGAPNQYWIFYLKEPTGFPIGQPGVYRATIDMTLYGGLGGVVPSDKDIPVPGAELAYDKLTGTRHHNNRDAWVVTHDTNENYLAYLVNSLGISDPVINQSSIIANFGSRQGDLKISPDGEKLVSCQGGGGVDGYDHNLAECCSFNDQTGEITPLFRFHPDLIASEYYYPQWAEFSPNSKLLYIGVHITMPPASTTKFGIFQYDATKTDSAGFMNSQVFLGYVDHPGARALQMAPNGKIYSCLSNMSWLCVINQPNLPGLACDFQINGFNLSTANGIEGLPQFLQKYKAYIGGSTASCQGDPVQFTSDTWPPADTIAWDFGDPGSGNKNTSTLENPAHNYLNPGSYTVKLYVRHNDNRTDTTWKMLTIYPNPLPSLGPDRTINQGDSTTFDAGFCMGCTYQWANLTVGNPNIGTGQTYKTGQAGTYIVTVTSPNGCVGRDTIQLIVNPVNPGACTGYEFWFAAPAVTNHTVSPSPVSLTDLNSPISMFFTTDEGPVTVTVDQPANPLFTPITCTVNNDSAEVIVLTPFLEMIENKPADSLLNYGLRVRSDKRISATYEIQSPYNAATYSLYGKDALGQSFIIPAQHNYSNYPYCSPPARNSFEVVATEDSTIVTIIPAKDVIGHSAQVPFSFLMNRGQTWSGRATSGDATMHLGGTTVTSTKPVAVTVTDDALFLAGYDDLAFDVAGDQLVPETLARKEFIALAMSIPAVKTLLLCYAKEDNTTVIFNDSISIKTLTINQGECAQFAFDDITNSSAFIAASIRSDKPVSVYEFTGNENEFMQPYHSFQASGSIIPPVECRGSKKATISNTPPGTPWHTWMVYAIAKRENGDGFICDPPGFINNVGTPVPGTGGVWGYSLHGISNPNYYHRVKVTNTKGRFFIPAYSYAVTSTGQFSKYAYFTDFTALNLGVDRKICPGDCMLLDAGSGWNNYLWSTGDTTSTIIVRTAGTFWVTTTEPECQLSDTIVISYYPETPVNLGPDRSMCAGDSVLLNAGPGRAWYLWNTGATTPAIWAKTSGNYWVKAGDVHCDVSDTVSVTILSPPVIPVGPHEKTICSGESTQLALISNPAATLYTWVPTLISGSITGFTSDSGLIINDTLINNSSTSGVVIYHVTPKIGGCTGETVDFTVTVTPGNPVAVGIAASGQSVCAGTTVQFTANPVNPGTNPVYQWKVNGLISGVNSALFSYIPQNNDKVWCVLTSSNTVCVSNNPASSDTLTMTVYQPSVVSISITTPSNAVCLGEMASFTATTVNAGSGPFFEWQVNGNNLGPNSPAFSCLPANGDVVSCRVSSSANCVTGSPAVSNAIAMTVSVGLPASVSIAANPIPFCEGSSVTFNATATNGGANPSWQWKVNGQNQGNNAATYSYVPQPGDSVRCQLTSNLACVTGNPAGSQNIILNPAPKPNVSLTICFDTITTLSAQPFLLRGGLPPGGTFSGPGVNSTTGIFNPSAAGTGTKTISYSYQNAYTCTDLKTRTIRVLPTPNFTCGGIFTDPRDNKPYTTVQIGTQCWMSSNFEFGRTIDEVIPQTDNCIAERYHSSLVPRPSYFYQWDELMCYDPTPGSQGLCPPGWHVPTETEWTALTNFYNGSSQAGRPLQDTVISGFRAHPDGVFYLNSSWNFAGFAVLFWTSTPWDASRALSHGMNSVDFSVSLYPASRANAFPVRCVRNP